MTDPRRPDAAPAASLKPCPFCGGINIVHVGPHMDCWTCGCEGANADDTSIEAATAAWNRRPPPAEVGEPTDSQMLEQAAAWLDEAADDITDWAGYASDYFQEKHNLARDVAEVRERATYLRSLRGNKT